jgi:hypothetical protein
MIETSAYPVMAVQEVRATTPKASLGVVAGMSAVLVLGLWFAGNGQLLRLAIPAMATFLGLVLYLRYPILYVQYSLWVWFLAPLVRRVVDWRFGWVDPNIVLLAPVLVSGITVLVFLRKAGEAWNQIPPAFVLCGTAILYGFAVGMVLHPSAETVFGLLNWLCPLLFGLHLYLNWPEYEEHRAAILKTFLWGVLVMGVYGVYQFFAPPGWDRYWLDNVRLDGTGSSFGEADSLMVRVWSTMNAPGPFANTMMVGLLLLFAAHPRLKVPAAITGYVSFLLSAVRTAWLSWVVGLAWILKSAKPSVIARILISLAFLLICLVPLIGDPRLAPVVSDRMATFMDLGHDASLADRVTMYHVYIKDALDNPFGTGLKNLEVSHGVGVDSGFMTLAFSLGWVGSLLMLSGAASLFLVRNTARMRRDDFANVALAIMVAIVTQLIGGNIFVSVSGVLFWMFAGMYLAAGKHHAAFDRTAVQAC